MKRLLLTICFLIACQFVNGQTFFNKTYDFEGGNDIGSCLLEADSGYFSTVQIIESGKRNTAISSADSSKREVNNSWGIANQKGRRTKIR